MTRFQYDFSLLSALLAHWRQETHTFHFTVGEITMTLQDTLLLSVFKPVDLHTRYPQQVRRWGSS
jgi:hypothetical protein